MGRLLNPAAVFCADRARYHEMLGTADEGSDAGLEAWCAYVLAGVLEEMKKVDQLADYAQLQARILMPAVAYVRERQSVTPQEAAVLAATIRAGVVKSADLEEAMPGLSASQRTYQIRKLVESRLIARISQGARFYTICFSHSVLLRGVVRALADEGFIPSAVAGRPAGA